MTNKVFVLLSSLYVVGVLDGERGPGNMAVDLQRNRIITTTALKEAESLADFGKSITAGFLIIEIPCVILGNLQEAKQKVKAAIVKLESSKSKDEKLCKVSVNL